MTDLVQRLRALVDVRPEPEPFEVWREAAGAAIAAADEIERLRADEALLRQALNALKKMQDGSPWPRTAETMIEALRERLIA